MALLLPAAAWYGFVVSRLWGWFVVPLGAPRIGVWFAAGLYTLARFVTQDTRAVTEEDDRTLGQKLGRAIAVVIIFPALTLLFGFIYHVLA